MRGLRNFWRGTRAIFQLRGNLFKFYQSRMEEMGGILTVCSIFECLGMRKIMVPFQFGL